MFFIIVVMKGVLYKSLCAVYRGLLYCYYKGGIHMNGVLYFGYKHVYPKTNICIKGIPFGGTKISNIVIVRRLSLIMKLLHTHQVVGVCVGGGGGGGVKPSIHFQCVLHPTRGGGSPAIM